MNRIEIQRRAWFGKLLALSLGFFEAGTASAQFVGHWVGEVTIIQPGQPLEVRFATTEIVPRPNGKVLVTLRDGVFNPSMLATPDAGFLIGQDMLPNGVYRSLDGGFSVFDPNVLVVRICLGPSPSIFNYCDLREFQFEGIPSPYGACVYADGICQQRQEFFCEGDGGMYIGDVPCGEVGACRVVVNCSLKTLTGCDGVDGKFDGPGTRCPIIDMMQWANTSGGEYAVAANWSPAQVPVHDGLHSDVAKFALGGNSPIPITTTLATAGRWEILDTNIAITGDATLSSLGTVPSSLGIGFGGRLDYESGFLTTQHAIIGNGPPASRVVLHPGSMWFNLGTLRVGTNEGEGRIELGELSFLDSSGTTEIGGTSHGELLVELGAVAQFDGGLFVGSVSGGTGAVVVTGSVATRRSRLQVSDYLNVGNLSASGATGALTVQDGAEMVVTGSMSINHRTLSDATAAVTVDGVFTDVDIQGPLTIGELDAADMLISNSGSIICEGLYLGSVIPGSHGQLRLEGLSSGILAGNQGINVGASGGQGSIQLGANTFLNTTGWMFVGSVVGGSVSTSPGATVTVGNGLNIATRPGAQGTVTVSGLNSKLTVTGSTEVGDGAVGSRAVLTVENQASAKLNGNLFVDYIAPAADAAALQVLSGGALNVLGDISIGISKPGDMIASAGVIQCNALHVGSENLEGWGSVTLKPQSLMYVATARIGGTGGFGVMSVDAGAILELSGNMSVGSIPGGLVTVDGLINGLGLVTALPGGIVNGTGRIKANKVENGGTIAPGLSPGTLTIEGDYEQLPSGRLEMEYSGLNPGAFDRLVVTGQATLGGTLEIQFTGGFSPSDPNVFVLSQSFIEADGGVNGDYEERLIVYPDLFADFDDDGDKDLLDAARFQNCFGLSGTALEPACDRADWEADGVIGRREIRELVVRLGGPQS